MLLEQEAIEFISGNETISTTANSDIDTITISDTNYVKWIIYLQTTGKNQALEVMAVTNGSTPAHTTYATVGDEIDYVLAVNSDGVEITLNITNNEANDLIVKFKRLITEE